MDATNMSDKKAQTPKRGIKLKPCIAEMLRTQVCPTKPTFLLDRVIVVTLPHGRDGNSNAYRLYLSDGEKTIQALLTSEIHRIFIYEEAKEGSYLVLDKYKLKRGKRLFGNGDVAFLAIAEFHEIGYQPRFKWTGNFEPNALLHDLSEREAKRYPPERHTNSKQKERDYSGFVARDPKPDDQLVDWIQRYDRCYDSASEGDEENNGGGIWKGSGKRKRTSGAGVLQELSANRLDFPHHDREPKKPKQADSSELDTTKTCASLPKSLMFYEHEIMEHHKRCQIGLLKHCPRCECTVCRPLLRGTSATTNLQPQRTASTAASALSLASITLSQYAIRALEVGKPLQPIDRWLNIHRLINFADIMRVSPLVDVLAVVQWVDNKTFKRGSSLLTRHIRIVDQSTWKKVLLSVSVDAVNFTPAVGTIALFRNLRWCKFDGGSLVADNFDCEGKDWFIPNPIGIVPESTVKQLREEWETLQEMYARERNIDARIKEVMGDNILAGGCDCCCDSWWPKKSVDYKEYLKLRKLELCEDEGFGKWHVNANVQSLLDNCVTSVDYRSYLNLRSLELYGDEELRKWHMYTNVKFRFLTSM